MMCETVSLREEAPGSFAQKPLKFPPEVPHTFKSCTAACRTQAGAEGELEPQESILNYCPPLSLSAHQLLVQLP